MRLLYSVVVTVRTTVVASVDNVVTNKKVVGLSPAAE